MKTIFKKYFGAWGVDQLQECLPGMHPGHKIHKATLGTE